MITTDGGEYLLSLLDVPEVCTGVVGDPIVGG